MTKPSPRRISFAAAATLLIASTTPGRAVTPAIVVDEQLRQHTVRVQRLEDGGLSFFDTQRRLVVEPVQRYVQLLVEVPASPSPPTGDVRVTMADGRRIVGTWRGVTSDGDAVRIANRWIGQVAIPLEEVGCIDFRDAAAPSFMPTEVRQATTAFSDEAVLGNGDVLAGFVIRVYDEHVDFQMIDTDAPVPIPRGNLRTLVLANAPGGSIAARPRVAFSDSTLLDFVSVRITSDRLIAMRGDGWGGICSEPIVVPMQHVRQIDFDTAGTRLAPLHDLSFHVEAGGNVFGLHRPPVVTASGAMRLHAPLTVAFSLPPGAERFAATARVEGVGEASAWADMQLRVESTEGPPRTYALSRHQREVFINQGIGGQTLTLTLEPAANGPVMDRLRLVHGTVLVTDDTPHDADVEHDR